MALSERPPILTIHEDSGDYILRLGDNRFRPLVVQLSKLLTDARRLIVVTPTDVKFFTGNGTAITHADSDAASDIDPAAAPPAEVIAEQESHTLPSQEEAEAVPPKLTRRRKPLQPTEKAGQMKNCQRCAGTGVIKTLMPDRSAAESGCPVCRGEGTMKRFGRQR